MRRSSLLLAVLACLVAVSAAAEQIRMKPSEHAAWKMYLASPGARAFATNGAGTWA